MIRPTPWMLTTLACLVLCFVGNCARGEFILDTELIVNGNAETGNTAGWISNGMEIGSRDFATTNGLPPGVDIGNFSFWAGEGPAESQTLLQTVDLAGGAAMIDAGVVGAAFSILLQSRSTSGGFDAALASLAFLDEQGGVIRAVGFQDRSVVDDVFDWDYLTSQQVLPAGTRTIEILLEATRTGEGISSDGLFDNASLKLTAVPEPSGLMLVGLGSSLLLARYFRRGHFRFQRHGK